MKRGEAALAAARLELHNRPRWYMRLATITFASCHVLVVIAFWASLAQLTSP